MNRRDFFKIVTTAGTAAAAAGCRQATESILPLVVPNDQIVPGVASWFSTVCRECPAGCGVIARNREGRVVKLEGNPDHPVNAGALCVRGQAALQGLYHPDRFDGPQRRDGDALKKVSWDDALKLVTDKITALRTAGKGPAGALMSQLENGSLATLMDRWTQTLGTRARVTLEPFGYEAMRAANRLVLGRDAIPTYAFDDAEVILSFGADFIETWLSNVSHARTFGRMHGFREGRAGTFIHIEPRQSLTAANADEWIGNAPGTEGLIALAVLKIMIDEGLADRQFAAAAGALDLEKVVSESGVPFATLRHIAEIFGRAKPGVAIGGGVAVTGTHATSTLAAINVLNAAAGNLGKTVIFGPDSAYGKVTPYADVRRLVQAMANGEIEVLLLGPGVNPAFTLPASLKFTEAVRRVGLVVSFAREPDETTALAHVVLPDTHWLESWGDYSPRAGVTGLMQPTMGVVRDSRPLGDALLAIGHAVLGGDPSKGPLPWSTFEEFLKSQWTSVGEGWETALERGGIWSQAPRVATAARVAPLDATPARLEGDTNGFALVPYPSFRFYDGRSGGRAWLQEAPDTMTQAVWDAWVEVPTNAAVSLGITNGDVVRVSSPYGALELPAYVSATLHPKTVAVPIGHRYAPYHVRRTPGVSPSHLPYVAEPPTVMNPIALLPPAPDPSSGGLMFLSVRVTLAKTGTRRPLAIVQATHDQEERELAQHVDLQTAREQELRGKRLGHEILSMYPDQKYPGYRWGMAIDVDACVGCQACVVACQAENNIAVVGKAQAAYGRQMQWLRIERWAEGRADHPHNLFLPMLCQHCEVAPCEPVCPVFAAYRTDEGLNGQVYNRCVGTRYCGNNCPYHVRRFNWYQWEIPAPLEIQLNPDVTVRQLGIMEKCTMCVQRIIAGKDHARDRGRPVKDGDILTACQQTCPTRAITFGNLKDEGSAVAKLSHSPRGYHVLDELGTRPAITYLKKVTRGHA